MYEAYFGLKTKPFDLVPNPDFMYLSYSHKKALNYLEYGIRERIGFVMLSGEIGCGKTTIIRQLLNSHYENIVLSKVFNTLVDFDQLLAMINEDFGLSSKDKDKISLMRDLNEFLIDQFAQGNRPVLIIDEAQNLSSAVLEEIRMLSNLETTQTKLLQIILVGQPELRDTLRKSELRQLRQRISINCHLSELTRLETEEYILHRLEVAGNRDAVVFMPEAIDVIFRFSHGVPRLINIICDFLLLSAFAEEAKVIDKALARDVMGDLDYENSEDESASLDSGALPISDGVASREHNDKPVSGIKDLMDEIVQRLDVLENQLNSTSQSDIKELKDKIASFQLDFKQHIGETSIVVAELNKRCEALINPRGNSGNSNDGSKQEKPGFFRKIIGGD